MVNVSKALAPKRGRKRKTDKSKAVAYIRVSTGKQELGPEAQRESIERFAAANGITVVEWHEETVSGGTPLGDRLGLFEAIELAKEQRAGLFLVAKRDRFARDSLVTELLSRDMAQHGLELVSTDQTETNGSSPEAMLLRRMLDAVAEYERALISARTKAALAARKRRGLRGSGSIPYGYRLATDGEKLEKHPQEAPILEWILAAADAGQTIQAIVDGLNAKGTPARGKRWHRTTVSRIIRSR